DPQCHIRPAPATFQQTQPRAPPEVVVLEATHVSPAVVQAEPRKGVLSVPSADPAAMQVIAVVLSGRSAPVGGMQLWQARFVPLQVQGRTPSESMPQPAHALAVPVHASPFA